MIGLGDIGGIIGGGSVSGMAVFHNQIQIMIGSDANSLQDVTALLSPMPLLSIHYEDPISFQADTLELNFADIGDQIIKGSLAKKGMWMTVKILQHNRDYPGSMVMKDLGSFQIDQIKTRWPPTQVTLMGTSVPIDKHIKLTLQNKVRLAVGLKGVAQQVADENGLQLVWQAPEGKGWQMSQADQWNESDLTMLSKYLKQNALSYKIKMYNGKMSLVVFDEQDLEQKPPVYTIDFAQPGAGINLTNGELTTQSQDIYSTAQLSWYDSNANTSYVAKADAPPGTAEGTGETLNSHDGSKQPQPGGSGSTITEGD
jgi:hypothetical protein